MKTTVKMKNLKEGIFRKNSKGFGFVQIEGNQDKIYIASDKLLQNENVIDINSVLDNQGTLTNKRPFVSISTA